MVDVTLEIMLEPPTHDLSYDPEKAARRFRRGDILDVIRTDTFAELDVNGDYRITEGIGNLRFGYIHLLNVPNARAQQMRRVLTRDSGETITRQTNDPELGLVDTEHLDNWRKRAYRIPRSVIPTAARTKLLAEREITVEWTTFRSRIRRKIAANRTDPSLDDESNAVTDAELS